MNLWCIDILVIITVFTMKALGHVTVPTDPTSFDFVHHPQKIPEAMSLCLPRRNMSVCFKQLTLNVLDQIINDNSTWNLSEYLTLEKDSSWRPQTQLTNYSDFGTTLREKSRGLFESRALKFRLTPYSPEKGRKKDKGGKTGMMMMGAMGAMGLVASMVMGKIALVSAAALFLSKIALLASVLLLTKKSEKGGKDNFIYSETGSGGSGWHRSIPDIPPNEDIRTGI